MESNRSFNFYDHEGTPLYLAVLHLGLKVYHQNLQCVNIFSWAKMRKMSFKKKRFLVKLHPDSNQYYKDTVEFYFETRNECKMFWKKCIEHHGFFRCCEIPITPRQQSTIFSKGSSFRYCGRTQKQLIEYIREHHKRREPFTRPVHSSFCGTRSSVGVLATRSGHSTPTDGDTLGRISARSLPTPVLASSYHYQQQQYSNMNGGYGNQLSGQMGQQGVSYESDNAQEYLTCARDASRCQSPRSAAEDSDYNQRPQRVSSAGYPQPHDPAGYPHTAPAYDSDRDGGQYPAYAGGGPGPAVPRKPRPTVGFHQDPTGLAAGDGGGNPDGRILGGGGAPLTQSSYAAFSTSLTAAGTVSSIAYQASATATGIQGTTTRHELRKTKGAVVSLSYIHSQPPPLLANHRRVTVENGDSQDKEGGHAPFGATCEEAQVSCEGVSYNNTYTSTQHFTSLANTITRSSLNYSNGTTVSIGGFTLSANAENFEILNTGPSAVDHGQNLGPKVNGGRNFSAELYPQLGELAGEKLTNPIEILSKNDLADPYHNSLGSALYPPLNGLSGQKLNYPIENNITWQWESDTDSPHGEKGVSLNPEPPTTADTGSHISGVSSILSDFACNGSRGRGYARSYGDRQIGSCSPLVSARTAAIDWETGPQLSTTRGAYDCEPDLPPDRSLRIDLSLSRVGNFGQATRVFPHTPPVARAELNFTLPSLVENLYPSAGGASPPESISESSKSTIVRRDPNDVQKRSMGKFEGENPKPAVFTAVPDISQHGIAPVAGFTKWSSGDDIDSDAAVGQKTLYSINRTDTNAKLGQLKAEFRQGFVISSKDAVGQEARRTRSAPSPTGQVRKKRVMIEEPSRVDPNLTHRYLSGDVPYVLHVRRGKGREDKEGQQAGPSWTDANLKEDGLDILFQVGSGLSDEHTTQRRNTEVPFVDDSTLGDEVIARPRLQNKRPNRHNAHGDQQGKMGESDSPMTSKPIGIVHRNLLPASDAFSTQDHSVDTDTTVPTTWPVSEKIARLNQNLDNFRDRFKFGDLDPTPRYSEPLHAATIVPEGSCELENSVTETQPALASAFNAANIFDEKQNSGGTVEKSTCPSTIGTTATSTISAEGTGRGWIKGHSDEPGNEAADELARNGTYAATISAEGTTAPSVSLSNFIRNSTLPISEAQASSTQLGSRDLRPRDISSGIALLFPAVGFDGEFYKLPQRANATLMPTTLSLAAVIPVLEDGRQGNGHGGGSVNETDSDEVTLTRTNIAPYDCESDFQKSTSNKEHAVMASALTCGIEMSFSRKESSESVDVSIISTDVKNVSDTVADKHIEGILRGAIENIDESRLDKAGGTFPAAQSKFCDFKQEFSEGNNLGSNQNNARSLLYQRQRYTESSGADTDTLVGRGRRVQRKRRSVRQRPRQPDQDRSQVVGIPGAGHTANSELSDDAASLPNFSLQPTSNEPIRGVVDTVSTGDTQPVTQDFTGSNACCSVSEKLLCEPNNLASDTLDSPQAPAAQSANSYLTSLASDDTLCDVKDIVPDAADSDTQVCGDSEYDTDEQELVSAPTHINEYGSDVLVSAPTTLKDYDDDKCFSSDDEAEYNIIAQDDLGSENGMSSLIRSVSDSLQDIDVVLDGATDVRIIDSECISPIDSVVLVSNDHADEASYQNL